MKKSPLIFDKVTFDRGGFHLEADVRFQEGLFTVVLGPSGSGKTTLLDLAAGFLQPSSGSILEGERDVTILPPNKRRVGVVFQDNALFPHLSVRDNVAYGPRVRGASRAEAYGVADRYLEMTRMTRYSSRKPSSLSGGEQQRISLARALTIEPELLLLDEPFSALDASLRKDLRNEVRQIQRETGITALLVTHDQDEALALADELAVMRNGTITQKARSEIIWKYPTDLFTALFVGRTSRLSVKRISGKQNAVYLIETDVGVLEMTSDEALPSLPATLIVRPEDLMPEKDGCLRGTVTEREYSGGHWKITLAAGSFPDKIDWDYIGTCPPGLGETVRFNIRPGSGRILPGNAEQF